MENPIDNIEKNLEDLQKAKDSFLVRISELLCSFPSAIFMVVSSISCIIVLIFCLISIGGSLLPIWGYILSTQILRDEVAIELSENTTCELKKVGDLLNYYGRNEALISISGLCYMVFVLLFVSGSYVFILLFACCKKIPLDFLGYIFTLPIIFALAILLPSAIIYAISFFVINISSYILMIINSVVFWSGGCNTTGIPEIQKHSSNLVIYLITSYVLFVLT